MEGNKWKYRDNQLFMAEKQKEAHLSVHPSYLVDIFTLY